MKQIKLILTATSFSACFIVTDSCSQITTPGASSVRGVFAASSPCGNGDTRPLPGIPVNADCEFIKWNLTLYQNPNTFSPTTYKLTYVYGLSQPGTPGFISGGTKGESQGKWTIIKGTGSNPGAVIYQLDPDKPQTSISFLKLNDDLLHLLDNKKQLMIGSASWSYTLNKVKNE